MRTYKQKTIKVFDNIYCDVCGISCTITEPCIEHEYAKIEATWGYFSHQDGTQYDIELCEHCFNEVLQSMKKTRERILGPFKYPHKNDPLKGKSYLP